MPADNIFVMEQLQYGPVTTKQKNMDSERPHLSKGGGHNFVKMEGYTTRRFSATSTKKRGIISGGRLCSIWKHSGHSKGWPTDVVVRAPCRSPRGNKNEKISTDSVMVARS